MKKLTCILCICFCLGACASHQVPENALLSSLNVGVQNDIVTASQIAGMIFPETPFINENFPHSLEYNSSKALQKGLDLGNYDIVIGLLESLKKDKHARFEYMALKHINLQYFVLPERKDLALSLDANRFFTKVKSVGYVSIGEVGNLNSTIVRFHPNYYSFVPCGSMMDCINMLQSSQIDAFATNGLSSNKTLEETLASHNIQISSAQYSERHTLGVAMNPVSLTRQEIQTLADLFWARVPFNNSLGDNLSEVEIARDGANTPHMDVRASILE
ncbi:hypothetical protein TDB9533_04598 [Thalassocella blandensis]|nr:hypothetical protein TDB9533_04598 [Thalassocella blandensis]